MACEVRAPTLARLAIAVSLAYSMLSACCEEPTKPCLPWLEAGETYRVELVQHFDTRYDTDFNKPVPHSGYRKPDRTCGSDLDLAEGAVVTLKAGDKLEDSDHQKCVGGCYFRRAIPTIDNVDRVGEAQQGRDIGGYEFSDQFAARVGDSCLAQYTIGIEGVLPHFIEESDEYVATDYMLYRALVTPEYDACLAPGSEIAESGRCWDSWAVRISDSQGRMITRDLPAKPGMGGTDGSVEAGDGGM